jgi:hypothetical protein
MSTQDKAADRMRLAALYNAGWSDKEAGAGPRNRRGNARRLGREAGQGASTMSTTEKLAQQLLAASNYIDKLGGR